MGLFGFGKKKREREEAEAKAENREDEAAVDTEETAAPTDVADTYEGRGESYGPWDVDDENVPDYDEYLDMGSYYLPYLAGLQLRIKANRSTQEILGATISYGASSLEIERSRRKTMGLWDDVRADLLEANEKASEHAGVFGTELHLPVTVKGGKTVNTRIVGVDGPRWMLRGIFSGKAANDDGNSDTEALNKYFADIVVERGDEPLAPRDLIPMHPPVTPPSVRRRPRPMTRLTTRSTSTTSRTSPKGRSTPISRPRSRPRCRVDRCSPKSADESRARRREPRNEHDRSEPEETYGYGVPRRRGRGGGLLRHRRHRRAARRHRIDAAGRVVRRVVRRHQQPQSHDRCLRGAGGAAGRHQARATAVGHGRSQRPDRRRHLPDMAWQSHEARNYYMFGFLTNAVYIVLLSFTLLIRVPGLGLMVEFIRTIPPSISARGCTAGWTTSRSGAPTRSSPCCGSACSRCVSSCRCRCTSPIPWRCWARRAC